MKGKECMAVNNPAGKPDLSRTIGADLSRGPDITYTAKIESWRLARVANTTYGLNVRSEPNLDSKLVCVINNSDDFNVSALSTPDWYKVKLKDGTVGFVSSKYVSVVGG